MPLERIEILGYRGFRVKGTVDFAIPNGDFGSGLTILTGTNNSGKSSILESLRARSGHFAPSFTVGARNPAIDEVEIKYFFNGTEEMLKSLHKGTSETKRPNRNRDFHIFVVPSRRAFNSYFGKVDSERGPYLNAYSFTSKRNTALEGFEGRLFQILKNPIAFNNLLRQVLLFEPNWTIDQSDQGLHYLKFYNGHHSHSSDGMGEGVVSLFAIVDSLYDSKPGDVIAVDEPELSLHPSIQKRLSLLFGNFARDRQIIISTHSPYFADLEAISNGGALARVVSDTEGTIIHQISDKSRLAIKKLTNGNIYNPHVFGLDARELFFQEDNLILTEGQEDVLLYPKVAAQLGQQISGSFFGWGAGGAGNIKHLCGIFSELGFTKVASLLDGDKVKDVEDLRKLYPHYFFRCIPAKDIRTKPARVASVEVSGLLDESLNLKSEYFDDTNNLLEELGNYLNSDGPNNGQ